jgi:hypothetical protein
LGVAVAVWAVCAWYSVRLRPDTAFLRHGYERKIDWLRQLRASHTNVLLIYGGSSCGTSINTRLILEQHGLPVVNLGLGASLGAKLLTQCAFDYVKAGDTLLVALEPELFAGADTFEPLGVQFAFAVGRTEWLRERTFTGWASVLLDLRPGGQHVAALAGKVAFHQPLLRYALTEWQPDGWHQVNSRLDFPAVAPFAFRLTSEGRNLLTSIVEECRRRRARVAYVLPWSYCTENEAETQKVGAARFLIDVLEVMPVVKDRRLGVHTIRADFADTPFHPTSHGAKLRSEELAESLKTWSLWTPEELAAICATRPAAAGRLP